MKTTGNTGTLEGLVGSVDVPDGHQTGHFNLGELDLAAAKGSQGLERGQWNVMVPWTGLKGATYDVGDLELLSGGSHGDRLEWNRNRGL